MPRRKNSWTGSLVLKIVSVLLVVGVSIGLDELRYQRRAARNQGNVQFDGNRGGSASDVNPGAPPVAPSNPPVQPQPQPQPKVTFPPIQPRPQFPPSQSTPEPIGLKPGVRETTPTGGAFANNDYREYRPEGSILTGFEVGYGKVFNTTIIAYLRPIWLTAKGEQYGIAYGKSQTPTVVVRAKNGYAVGGIVIAGGGALEGFALTFMRIGEKHLVADDAYTSEWYGEPTRKPRPEGMKAGDGSFVVGLFGKRFNDKRGNNYDDGGAIATIGFVLWVKE